MPNDTTPLPVPPEPDKTRPRFRTPVPLEGDGGTFSQTWWPVCLSSDLAQGQIKGIEFLAGKIVAFRGEDGVAHVTSA